MQQIIKDKNRNHAFQHMMRFIRKGIKGALRRLHITNDDSQITRIFINRDEIESTILE